MKDLKKWNIIVEMNTDLYGKCCVDIAEEVMQHLDINKEPLSNGYYPKPNTAHTIIFQANDKLKTGGITGFMANMIVDIVEKCHERGREFRLSYYNQIK
jgi:hypothetical protein